MPSKALTYPLRRLVSVYRPITCQHFRLPTVATFVTSSEGQSADRVMPVLSAETADGTSETISEEGLYRYTRNRWIHNESVQLSERYLKFDLEQLLKAAVTAVSSEGARYCTRILKCREGLNNKAYLLTMDNGSEVFAKPPNPIAGPAYYTTASEVATREFLRDALNIPIPRVIAWSADQNNPVGAEYILEEKALGKPLGGLWYQWPMKFKLNMIQQIVEFERQLASIKFKKSGCIFFKDDIKEDVPGESTITTSESLDPSILGRFKLGPLVSTGLWCGKRAGMDMYRGPYNDPLEYVKAMATNEMRYINMYARPRMNYHRSSTEPERPEEVLDLLDRYLRLTSAMIPPQGTDDTHSPTLWHPDLHLDNVFVDPESKQITCIIDWQSAAALPFFYQCGIARMFQHPGTIPDGWAVSELPEDYNKLDESEKDKIDSNRNSEICHKYYEAETKSKNPRHWAALQLDDADVRIEPSRLVLNVWEDHDVFFLRRALLSIVEKWQELCPGSDICPVSFNEQELAQHAAEEESMSNVGEILRIFKDNWGLPPNGMVDPTEFDQIRTAVSELRTSFIEGADDEAERELFARLWPYQDKNM